MQLQQIKTQQQKHEQIKPLQGKHYMIDQNIDWPECLASCFCQTANYYSIYQTDPNYYVCKTFGQVQQQSEYYERLFCICNRPMVLQLKINKKTIARAQRSLRCFIQCCPFAINQMLVRSQKESIHGCIQVKVRLFHGIINEFSNLSMTVYDKYDKPIYFIDSNACQSNIWFPCLRFCNPVVQYKIYNSLRVLVGKIDNIFNGCITQCCTKAQSFGIQFPTKATKQQKILLTFCAIYIDYLRYQSPNSLSYCL